MLRYFLKKEFHKGFRMKRLVLILFSCLLFLSICSLLSADAKGTLVYLDGNVEIHKSGEITGIDKLKTGFEINCYDLIETGADGYAEFEISQFMPESAAESVILKIENYTSVYFVSGKNMEEGFVQLHLLTGSINVKTGKLPSGEGMTVRTAGDGLVKANDASFCVVTAPDGAILVACSEGDLEFSIPSDRMVMEKAEAGMIVDAVPGHNIRSLDISAERFDVYKTEWSAERLRVFRSSAFSLTKPVLIQYEEYLEKYNLFYKELRASDKIFNKYKDSIIQYGSDDIVNKADNTVESQTDGENLKKKDIIADKLKAAPAVFKMRNIYFTFEELFFRIKDIKRYHDQIPVKGALRKKYDIDDFMKDFQKNHKTVEKKNTYVRQAFNIYSKMDAAGIP